MLSDLLFRNAAPNRRGRSHPETRNRCHSPARHSTDAPRRSRQTQLRRRSRPRPWHTAPAPQLSPEGARAMRVARVHRGAPQGELHREDSPRHCPTLRHQSRRTRNARPDARIGARSLQRVVRVAVAARTISEVSSLDVRARAEDRRISTLTIDSEIRFASPESRAAFAAELTNRLTELVAKYHDDESPRGRRFRLVTIGHPHPALPATDGAASNPPPSDVSSHE